MYSQQIKNLKAGEQDKPARTKTANALLNFCKREDVDNVKVKDVYSLYLEFCKEENLSASSPQEFGRAMSKAFALKTKNVRFGSEVYKVFFIE